MLTVALGAAVRRSVSAKIPLRLKMRKAHSTDVTELETHGISAPASLRFAGAQRDFGIRHDD